MTVLFKAKNKKNPSRQKAVASRITTSKEDELLVFFEEVSNSAFTTCVLL